MAPDPEAVKRMVAERTPLGRLGTADDVCDAVSFLASHRSGVMRWLRRHFKVFAPAGEAPARSAVS